ncbi:MAG TPA: D-glycerate dehydrogenase [Pirellulales bacterium]|jgi:glyoxylate reductase|nr:D-glycerate dehydrogenase [Pirellulales bacterium]
MPRPQVFITRRIPEIGLRKIAAACEVEVWPDLMPPPAAVLLEKSRGCAGILALLTDRIDAPFLSACAALKVISNFAVGHNNIDIAAATARGISVGNTPDVLTEATADLAFALLIAAARRVGESQQAAREGRWKTWEPLGYIGQDLLGKTVGIVGLGRIGAAFAKRCRGGFDMQVVYHNRRPNRAAEQALSARRVDFETLLSESDFISVHTDLNDSTRGLFNAAAFARMKPTAVFINTARGGVVVQSDLVAALRSGQIFAAGLDVTDPEPPDPQDPLLSLPNAIVLPHIASATVQSRDGMAEIAADNLLAGLRGEPLRCWVNPEVARR